jgi:glycolate oxidase FAD binding subunit
MVGSMGSLGIITEMTFRLMPLPEKMKTLLLGFDSRDAACDCVNRILKTKLLPAAVETMNRTAYDHLCFKGAPDFSPGRFIAAISLEAFAPAVDRMEREMLKTAEECGALSSADFSEHCHLQFWLAVSDQASCLDAQYANLIRAKVNYRISEWQNMIQFADDALSAQGINHTVRAHSGSGICLINLLLDKNADGLKPKAIDFMQELLELSRKAGGNTIIQNAPTDLKPKLKIWGETGSDFTVMKQLKHQLDPNTVLSPGRFVGGL